MRISLSYHALLGESERAQSDGVHAYVVVRLRDAASSCIALAAFSVDSSQEARIPEGLISDIGRALSARA